MDKKQWQMVADELCTNSTMTMEPVEVSDSGCRFFVYADNAYVGEWTMPRFIADLLVGQYDPFPR